MFLFTAFIQLCVGISSQWTKARKGNKRHTDKKGRNKAAPLENEPIRSSQWLFSRRGLKALCWSPFQHHCQLLPWWLYVYLDLFIMPQTICGPWTATRVQWCVTCELVHHYQHPGYLRRHCRRKESVGWSVGVHY